MPFQPSDPFLSQQSDDVGAADLDPFRDSWMRGIREQIARNQLEAEWRDLRVWLSLGLMHRAVQKLSSRVDGIEDLIADLAAFSGYCLSPTPLPAPAPTPRPTPRLRSPDQAMDLAWTRWRLGDAEQEGR